MKRKIKEVRKSAQKPKPQQIDYYARLLESQPKPISKKDMIRFWNEDRVN
jgi:hypothetical protein